MCRVSLARIKGDVPVSGRRLHIVPCESVVGMFHGEVVVFGTCEPSFETFHSECVIFSTALIRVSHRLRCFTASLYFFSHWYA